MTWSYRRRRNWFGAAVLIAVGVIGLAANFNLVSAEILDQLWKLWPVIPLAIGLSILIGRNRYSDDRASREADTGGRT
jgi:hypothetical protein